MLRQSQKKAISEIVGPQNLFTDKADLVTYSYDAAVLEEKIPAAVVRPTSSQSLGRMVGFCNEHGLPLTVRGAGTNLSGGTIPQAGGIVLVHPAARWAIAQGARQQDRERLVDAR